MSTIQSIREQLRTVQYTVAKEYARELTRRSAALEYELEELIYNMHSSGISVNAIAKEYGTKNWRTIRDILDRAESRKAGTTPDPSTTPASVVVTPVPESENPNGYPNPKRVSVTNYEGYTGSADYYTLNNGMNMLIDDTFEPGTPLLKAFWDTNSEVYTAMKEAQK